MLELASEFLRSISDIPSPKAEERGEVRGAGGGAPIPSSLLSLPQWTQTQGGCPGLSSPRSSSPLGSSRGSFKHCVEAICKDEEVKQTGHVDVALSVSAHGPQVQAKL